MDASFDSARLSLLDRGFAYAIAHIRGGQELGRAWYEDGKLLKKKNTFTDFIACADHLVREDTPGRTGSSPMGGSAGGLLIGAVVNMRPDLFKGVVAAVPFVDVVTTMLDPSIPLTTFEYDEWGNPDDRTYFDYMLSYSPYDNVEAKAYPNILVTTSLQDSQVQYWEPAKWVAKLRAPRPTPIACCCGPTSRGAMAASRGDTDAIARPLHRCLPAGPGRDRPLTKGLKSEACPWTPRAARRSIASMRFAETRPERASAESSHRESSQP